MMMQFYSRFTAMVLYLYYNCLKREWTALLLGKEEDEKKITIFSSITSITSTTSYKYYLFRGVGI